MPTCIYCRDIKEPSQFNREHVVPEAFGRFEGALVLHDIVCVDCNDYFGRTLDRIISRGSAEGLQRYFWGVKHPSEIERFSYNNLRLSSEIPGDYHGALLTLFEDADAPKGVKAVPVAQVGFAEAEGDGFIHFSLAEVKAGVWKDDPRIDWRKGVKILGPGMEETRALLEAQGVQITKWREMTAPPVDGEEIEVTEEYRVSSEFQRAIAKICFNYAAYVHGAAFMLQEPFDDTRRFIREGVAPDFRVWGPKDTDIFPYESADHPGMSAIFHVVTVTKPLNADVVLGQVSLFNWLQWEVVLSTSPMRNLRRSGHLFNPSTLTVHELGHRGEGGSR